MAYEDLFRQINRHARENPAEILFSGGVSDEWIARAESALGVRFPPSFHHFLRHYGGGTIGGEVINGLLGVEFAEACGPDIVYNTLLNRESAGLRPTLVCLVDNDGDEQFYLDTGDVDSAGEGRVLRAQIEEPSAWRPYAETFAEFLLKRIDFFLAGNVPSKGRQPS